MSVRVVQVSIGPPEELEDQIFTTPGDAALADVYCLNFIEEDSENESATGWTAHGACLCQLRVMTEAWLRGDSEEEVRALAVGCSG